MAQTIEIYGKALANLLGGETSGETNAVDYLSDTIKIALLGAGYTPNLDTHEFFSDVSAQEVSGAGYTAGGATLASKTIVYTVANSWSPVWAATTAYQVGDVVRPTTGNGHVFRCTVAGTSGGTEPTWVVTGLRETADGGTVKWVELGRGLTVIDAADPSWPASTITASYGVVYKSTGTGSTSQLIALLDFGASVPTSNGTFLITLPATGIFYSASAHRGVTP